MRTRPSGGPWPMQRATRPTSLRGRTATEDRVLSVPLSAFGVPEHVRGYEEAMASYTVNRRGVAQARKLIKAKRYVLNSNWGDVQPKAADENAFLKDHSWQEYAGWFLGLTEGPADETKGRYAFVYGDLRRLHRSGLIACVYRAAEWRHKEVERAAYRLLQELEAATSSPQRPPQTKDELRVRSAPVGQFSRQEVAERAGVDPDYVDRLVELGILRPDSGTTFSTGDVRRARWGQRFERAGGPLGGVATEGAATGGRDGALSFSYLDATAFDRFAGMSRTTFRELSERTGVPLDLLLVVQEAHGFAEPRPEDRVREDELGLVPAIELLLSFGIRPEAIVRLLRAYGDGLRRIVETETDWYRTEVELPFLE